MTLHLLRDPDDIRDANAGARTRTRRPPSPPLVASPAATHARGPRSHTPVAPRRSTLVSHLSALRHACPSNRLHTRLALTPKPQARHPGYSIAWAGPTLQRGRARAQDSRPTRADESALMARRPAAKGPAVDSGRPTSRQVGPLSAGPRPTRYGPPTRDSG